MNFRKNWKFQLILGISFLFVFIIFTILIKTIDVRPVGQEETNIGFSTINVWFHDLTGVNMLLYTITDWLGIVPVIICLIFGVLGLIQLIKRKSFLKVDIDILILGIYYIIVILGYIIFEMIPLNYRPVLIDGNLEASYPSSTTLLVLSVMLILIFQINRRIKNYPLKTILLIITILFSVFMVAGRTISGVHWLTDIIGSIILSVGLYFVYKSIVSLTDNKLKNVKN